MSGLCTSRIALALFVFVVLFSGFACAQENTGWKDPSGHTVQFVSVNSDVKLEVLDWGGTGQPIVLLAGYGSTAHVFDEFAEKLVKDYHVYGITRRGFGWSSHAPTGYDTQRLAQDVLNVLDSLKIASPVLVGHSLAGKEMTVLGKQADRVAGLVYLDALSDPTYDFSERNAIASRRPPERFPSPPRPWGKSAPTFEEYMKWQRIAQKAPRPEGELHANTETTPDGKMGQQRIAPKIGEAIADGMAKPDYASIRVPVLAFAAYPAPLEQQLKDYEVRNDADRKTLEDLYAADLKYLQEYTGQLERAVPAARLIRIPGADHLIFISNEADVLYEIRNFVRRLR